MKKIFCLAISLFLFTVLFSNPIMPYYISEVLIDGDDWQIEIYDYHQIGYNIDLSGGTFTCAAGSAIFNENLTSPTDEVMVISNSDLQTNLPLSIGGDNIVIQVDNDWEYLFAQICWGDSSNWVQAPLDGYSIKRCIFNSDFPDYTDYSRVFIDSQPTIGTAPYSLSSTAQVEANVYDAYNLPVSYFHLVFDSSDNYDGFVTSNQDGFLSTNIGARVYNLEGQYNDVTYWDSLVTLYPDSLYQFEIYTDIASSDLNEIHQPAYNTSNSPNPFNPVTTISFGKVLEQPAKVKIYNSKGGLVDELDCTKGRESISWDAGTTASGVYFYKLVVEGSEVGSGKMLLLK